MADIFLLLFIKLDLRSNSCLAENIFILLCVLVSLILLIYYVLSLLFLPHTIDAIFTRKSRVIHTQLNIIHFKINCFYIIPNQPELEINLYIFYKFNYLIYLLEHFHIL